MRQQRGTQWPLRSLVRFRLHDAIQANPGISFLELVPIARAPGATDYHLKILGEARLIQSVKAGRYRRYFPTSLCRYATAQLASLATPTMGDLLRAIREQPGQRLQVLAQRLGCSRQNITHHVKRLVARGLVQIRVVDGSNVYDPVYPTTHPPALLAPYSASAAGGEAVPLAVEVPA